MLPFSTLLLRSYYEAIGWNEDNLYSNLTRSSAALIDFPIPDSLILQLANSPTPIFFTSYALDALPHLNGSLSYITSSEPINHIGPSRTMPLSDVVERFRVFPPPLRPSPKPEIWQAGQRVEGRDFLLYSRLHLPTMHLSGLATTRIAPSLTAQLAFVHQPTMRPRQPVEGSGNAPRTAQPPGNLLLSLQHDTSHYSGEYTYSAADGMFGVRGLYNFGWHDVGAAAASETASGRRVDEEEAMEGGLNGRFSAGGEVYFSVKQRSLGLSTGVRFTTIPTPSSPGIPPSPPTTITVLYNPLIGFLSTAYSAQVSRNVSMATRFGVNVYSYESDFALGCEWWIGRRRRKVATDAAQAVAEVDPAEKIELPEDTRAAEKIGWWEIGGVLRDPGPDDVAVEVAPPTYLPERAGIGEKNPTNSARESVAAMVDDARDGVVKARLSGDWSLALLYEARIRNCLVSIGVVSDLFGGHGKVVRSLGLEVQYYS